MSPLAKIIVIAQSSVVTRTRIAASILTNVDNACNDATCKDTGIVIH